MLAGIAYLCRAYGIGATEPGQAGYESILSQLIAAVVGRGWFYYVTIGSVLSVLALSANTGFADFPRLCRVIAQDGFLPNSFAHRGRRLVYSHGILVLAVLSAGLLIALRRHHRQPDPAVRRRGVPGVHAVAGGDGGALAEGRRAACAARRWRSTPPARLCTAVTLGVVLVSKFVDGAWVMILLIPALLVLFLGVRGHYRAVAREVATAEPLDATALEPPGGAAADPRLERHHAQGAAVRPEDLARRLRPARRRRRAGDGGARRHLGAARPRAGDGGGPAAAEADRHLLAVPQALRAAEAGRLGPAARATPAATSP